MKVEVENIITLLDLCRILKIKKSRANYYCWLGLLTPLKTITGNTFIFDREGIIKEIKFIDKGISKGKTLKEIAEELRAQKK